MNQKQITILLVLLVALGAAGLMIYKKGNAERRSGQPSLGKKLLENFPVNDVAQIAIKQGTNEVTLVKKNDLWRVKERGDYAANYNEISDFLIKAKDLKVLRSDTVGPSQLGRLERAGGDLERALSEKSTSARREGRPRKPPSRPPRKRG